MRAVEIVPVQIDGTPAVTTVEILSPKAVATVPDLANFDTITAVVDDPVAMLASTAQNVLKFAANNPKLASLCGEALFKALEALREPIRAGIVPVLFQELDGAEGGSRTIQLYEPIVAPIAQDANTFPLKRGIVDSVTLFRDEDPKDKQSDHIVEFLNIDVGGLRIKVNRNGETVGCVMKSASQFADGTPVRFTVAPAGFDPNNPAGLARLSDIIMKVVGYGVFDKKQLDTEAGSTAIPADGTTQIP